MPDEIKKRLQECADGCIKSFEAWRGNEKDQIARESLQEAIHELRKVAARLEIELASSTRDQMAQKPIPIPSHRNSQGRGGTEPILSEDTTTEDGASPKPQDPSSRKPRRRRPPKKAAEA